MAPRIILLSTTVWRYRRHVDAGGSMVDPVTGQLRATAEAAADQAVAVASSNTEGHGGAVANTSMTLRR
uniref:Uncharacterized protein n=1 Tax=Oryza nivara TaxID=4536 RepID=A0A0E0IGN2_ORYNI